MEGQGIDIIEPTALILLKGKYFKCLVLKKTHYLNSVHHLKHIVSLNQIVVSNQIIIRNQMIT